MVPINKQDITALESKLGAHFPEVFTYLLSTYGLVRSPNVLSTTCTLSVDVSEVQDFLSLEDISALSSLYELTGMPKGHILFASDSKGNMFCFKADACQTKHYDCAVWYFDRAMSTVTKVSSSFVQWLSHFNELQNN